MPTPLSQNPSILPLAALRYWAGILRRLTRLELSSLVALSALAGFLFAEHRWSGSALLTTAAIWLLAAGSSALNQWQERDLDSRMQRTRLRPLPAGQLQPASVLLLSGGFLGTGLLLLATNGSKPLLLGLLAIIWYNGIYTPLKRRTAFAALPGAICGALPPLIGWSASGNSLLAPEILILFGTLFLWQIPHTWLLLCHYRSDLQRSGLPDLFQTISTARLLRINHCWLAALALCYLQFPLFGWISPLASLIFCACLGIICLAVLRELRKRPEDQTPLAVFHLLNLSMALLLLTLIID